MQLNTKLFIIGRLLDQIIHCHMHHGPHCQQGYVGSTLESLCNALLDMDSLQ